MRGSRSSMQEAYEAAAWHPNPAVQEDRDGTLPPEDVGFLARAEAISSSGPEEVLLARRLARQDAVHG